MTDLIEKSSLYKETYGRSAMGPGLKADHKKCCEEIMYYIGNWPKHKQCSRPRGFGPDKAYCKQHDPKAVKAREAAIDARQEAAWQKRRYEIHGKSFFDALVKIAEGHNDARGLAQEVINSFKGD